MFITSPCAQTGVCPSPLFTRELEKMEVGERCEMMAECSRIMGKIVAANDLEILHKGVVEELSDDNVITIGPNPCPMMTPYSWEVVAE